VQSSTIQGCKNPLPPPVVVKDNLNHKIAQVLDSKIDHWHKVQLLYYVQWARYEGIAEEFLWLGADELHHTSELVQEFHKQNPDKPGTLPQGQ